MSETTHLLTVPTFPKSTNAPPGKSLRTAGAADQGSVARLPTGGDGIRAAFAFGVAQLQQLGQRSLTAGTRLHHAWSERAGLTEAGVALLLALVGSAF